MYAPPTPPFLRLPAAGLASLLVQQHACFIMHVPETATWPHPHHQWPSPTARLDGTMSVTAREKAIQDFEESNTVFVLIVSLKVGWCRDPLLC